MQNKLFPNFFKFTHMSYSKYSEITERIVAQAHGGVNKIMDVPLIFSGSLFKWSIQPTR
jgi:hypothetical protein